MKTVASAIARQLEARNVQRIYQVPGESFLGLLDSLRDSPIRLVTARHEGGAGFMAMAEARVTGTTGIAMVTRGPGAANIAIAVHTAHQDATPLVVFVGLIPTAEREREAFQEFDIHAWFGSTSKAVIVLDDPQSAPERVARAFDIAGSGRPGPVIIGLPEELLQRECNDERQYHAPLMTSRVPSPSERERFLAALANAKRPVFVVGGDSWNHQDAQALRMLAESFAVPVVSDFRAQDVFPHSSESWVGSLGYGRNAGALAAYDEADFVCYLGTTRKDVLSDGFTLSASPEHVVVVNASAELREHSGRIDVHYVMNPSEWLSEWHHSARTAVDKRRLRLRELRKRYLEWSTPEVLDPAELSRESIFEVLREQLPEDAIYTVGAGNYAIGVLRYIHHETPRSFLGPRNGAMGFGMPGGVATSLARQDRLTVVFAGDGCFGMNGSELATLQMYGGRAIVFVLDNGGFGTIVSHQEKHFPDRPSGTYLTNPDYAAIADAHGLKSHRVTDISGFAEKVAAAVNSEGSTLFHVVLPQLHAGLGFTDGTELGAR